VRARSRAIGRARGGRDRVFVWSMCVWVNSMMHGWCGGLDYTQKRRMRAFAFAFAFATDGVFVW